MQTITPHKLSMKNALANGVQFFLPLPSGEGRGEGVLEIETLSIFNAPSP
jgi:hypothetical protein